MAARQVGFWDVEHRLRQLAEREDPLEKLAGTVDIEIFRAELGTALGPRDRSTAGRPSFHPVLKFRMLVLQSIHGLSLAQTEFLVADRLGWMRFCGRGPDDAAPDAATLWDFREALIAAVEKSGYLPMAGQIVDATLAAGPRQRNTEVERARTTAGEKAYANWLEKPPQTRWKDTDASWTVEFSKARPVTDGEAQTDIATPAFGCKNYIVIDGRHGIIPRAKVSDAAAHDRARLHEGLIDPNDTASDVRAESAFGSAENERFLTRIGKVSRIRAASRRASRCRGAPRAPM